MKISYKLNKKEKSLSLSDFECVKCGECCRAGYDVYLNKLDIVKWKKREEDKLLNHIIIKPQCISANNKTEFNSENGITIKYIQKNYKNFDKKIEELIEFIQKNHLYYGKSPLRQYIKTILPDLGYDPVLVPKSFEIILKGLEYGLEYIIEKDFSGRCAFLNLNLCLINDFKPIACQKFPFTKDKCLRKDEILLSVCKGLKKGEIKDR